MATTGFLEIQIIPIKPSPADFPAHLIPKLDSAIAQVLKGPIRTTLRAAFDRRTLGWRNRPYITGRYTRPATDMFVLDVFPSGSKRVVLKWQWVSRGTKKNYPIAAKRAPTLRFREEYTPHTQAGNLYGLPGGGTYSGDWRTPVSVIHPGIDAREFEENIKREEEKKIRTAVIAAVQLAMR